ncbi:hypothetical protein B0A49_12894 [Cryomyces minteri]|uniref:Uncharacterized protein n=1 Tax=Cryomyces minteri TaxID=331657 RepID=A0A4U0VLX0_9PEZI|nr:hypothetical protein B0A49_12894 [Cryomyces minteri]
MSQDVLSKIFDYAKDVHSAQEQNMEIDFEDDIAFETRLEKTLRELQNRMEQHRSALAALRASSLGRAIEVPSANPQMRLRQLQVIKSAYERLTPSEPSLPTPTSVLPALLATRLTEQTIKDSRAAISSTQLELTRTQERLEEEQSFLRDANFISSALEARIARLQTQHAEQSHKSSNQTARDLVRAKQQRKKELGHRITSLREAFSNFIEAPLAAMIAAEELGGPVVGGVLAIDDEMLEAGFNNQGKPKTMSKTTIGGHDAKRQRRIDEIWGASVSDGDQPLNEREAAATQMQELVAELVESVGSGEYVKLDRDSASARFLVRARVAQFHPKDARRLRLLDFGREFDD